MGPPSVSAGCERPPGSKGKGEGSQRGEAANPAAPAACRPGPPSPSPALSPLAKALLTHALILPPTR